MRTRSGSPSLALLVVAAVISGCTSAGARAASGHGHHGYTHAVAAILARWQIPHDAPTDIAGYASTTSIAPGDPVELYVSTPARTFTVRVFRMGWYAGHRAILVQSVAGVRGTRQSNPVVDAPRHTVVANWKPSLQLKTADLTPGDYLLRLDASDGGKSFIPLTVRARSAAGTVVLVTPVGTWQAYNRWGCCDLYAGANGSFVTRSRAVSFDRPYLAERGAGEFISRTLPVVAEAERLRLPLDYVTDIDVDRNPRLLDGARAVITMGHDEYWSPAMRTAVTRARDHGTNIAFFGANAVYRRVRFESSPLGPDRVEVDYKIAAEDPLLNVDPAAVTSDWAQRPNPQPPSTLLGESYGCFSHNVVAGIVIDPSNPLFRGTGVTKGSQLSGIIGEETDRIMPGAPRPGPVEILLHSPFPCPQGYASYADTTYYTVASGAGVIDSGTQSWVCALAGNCGDRRATEVVRRITDNVLTLFAAGPAAQRLPAHTNAAGVYPTG